jgi:hypothetical protein
MPIFVISVFRSFRLLKDKTNPLFSSAGGVACALLLALLVAGFGAQHLYPVESSVGMWAAIGIMLRVSVEQMRSRETAEPLFGEAQEAQPREPSRKDEPVAVEQSLAMGSGLS